MMPMTGPAIRPSVDSCPDLAFGRVKHAGGNDQKQSDFEPGAMPILEPRFGGPRQERHDIVRHLRHGGRRAVGKGHGVVAKRRRHGDLMTREKFIVVHPFEHTKARRSLPVAGENPVNVIGTACARLDDQRLIRRKGAVVCGTRRLIVRKWARDRIGGPARPLVHLTLVVRSVGYLIAGGDRFDLVLTVTDVRKVAEVEMLDWMTDRADFLVNLEPTLCRGTVVGSEDSVKGPFLTRQPRILLSRPGEYRSQYEG